MVIKMTVIVMIQILIVRNMAMILMLKYDKESDDGLNKKSDNDDGDNEKELVDTVACDMND